MAQQLGHFKIIDQLGKGGMGTVYKAHEISLNRTVAIKVLADHLAEDKTHVARFVREAQSAAALSHPNVVQIHFIGEDEGKHYFVMEYVRGDSLKQLLKKEGKLSCQKSFSLIRQAATGLAAAHELGLVHRDIKPANIMLTPDGMVKIADFGLAFTPQDKEKLTATGMFLGTPGYVAPEQCSGEPLDQRTDIYSLGVTLYEMLAGKSAFETESKSPLALIQQVMQTDPEDIRTINPDVDEAAYAILKKMIEKSPGNRYPDCHALLEDLGSYLSGIVETEVLHAAAPPVPTPPVVPPTPPVLPTDLEKPTVSAPSIEPPRVSSVAVPAKKKSAALVVALSVAAVVILAAVVGFLLRDRIFGASPETQVAQNEGEVQSASVGETAVADEGVVFESDLEDEPGTTLESGTETQPTTTGELAEFENKTGESVSYESDPSEAEATLSVAETSSEPAEEIEVGGLAATRAPEETKEAVLSQSEVASTQAELSTDSAEPMTVTSDPVEEREPTPEPSASRSVAVTDNMGPTVCVIVLGDRLVARPLEKNLENAFSNTQFEVIDEELNGQLDQYLRSAGENARLSDLMPLLKSAKSRFLVLARIEFLDERMLQYMGRSSRAYTSRVTITPFSVTNEKPIGQKFQDKFEYTTLNADRKAEQIAIRYRDAVRQRIKQAWTRRNR